MLKKLIVGGFTLAFLGIAFVIATPSSTSAGGVGSFRATGKGCTANIYKSGSKSTCVTYIQKMLNGINVKYGETYNGYSLVTDGVFGSKTKTQVTRYQKANGLNDDGIVGINTWSLICGRAGQASFKSAASDSTKHKAWDAAYAAGCYVEVPTKDGYKIISRY